MGKSRLLAKSEVGLKKASHFGKHEAWYAGSGGSRPPGRPDSIHEVVYSLQGWLVFWLSDHPTGRAFPSVKDSGITPAFVPDYSGGSATASHRLPDLRLSQATNFSIFTCQCKEIVPRVLMLSNEKLKYFFSKSKRNESSFHPFSAITSISKSSVVSVSVRLKAPSLAPKTSIVLKPNDFSSQVISHGT